MAFQGGDPRHRYDGLTGQAHLYGSGVNGHPDITVRLDRPIWPGLDWIIAGGESGPRAEPCHPDWARALRDDCAAAGVPFCWKQWGEWAPGACAASPQQRTEAGAWWFSERWIYERITPRRGEAMHSDDEPDLYRFGKGRAGRHLDGVVHDGCPWGAWPDV